MAALARGRIAGQSGSAGVLQRVEKAPVALSGPQQPLPGLRRSWDALRGVEGLPGPPGGARGAGEASGGPQKQLATAGLPGRAA